MQARFSFGTRTWRLTLEDTQEPNAGLRPLAVKPPAAARLLGISRSQLYELMAAGDLPSFYAGSRCRLIAISDIEAFIAATRKRAA